MVGLIREAPLGQVLRFITRNRVLKYPEELPEFELPETYKALVSSSSNSPKALHTVSNERTSRPSSSSAATRASEFEKSGLEEKEITQPGPYSQDAEDLMLSRTKSRHETVPYTEDRLEAEAGIAIERTQTMSIAPQKTVDGNILVDWYTTDDPENPQN